MAGQQVSVEEFAVGITLFIFVSASLIIMIIFKLSKVIENKNKDIKLKEEDISIKEQVIDIQKEIIEHQTKIFPLNHDN